MFLQWKLQCKANTLKHWKPTVKLLPVSQQLTVEGQRGCRKPERDC